jgi:hypothetical protein
MRVRQTLMGRTMKLYFTLLNCRIVVIVTIRNLPVNNNHMPNYYEKRWISTWQGKEVKIALALSHLPPLLAGERVRHGELGVSALASRLHAHPRPLVPNRLSSSRYSGAFSCTTTSLKLETSGGRLSNDCDRSLRPLV